MNVLDLFSGIGGFSLGLERAGMRTVAFCETDEYCRRVLAKHWPDVPCYPDIRDLTAEQLERDGIEVDVICGGFPCQDISSAAHDPAGIDGDRSRLWEDFARLIGEIRPRVALVENVSALRQRGLSTVLGNLAQIGYDAEWHCIPASAVGAPHPRDRVWIMAYPAKVLRQRERGNQPSGILSRDGLLSILDNQGRGEPIPAWWAAEPSVDRVVSRIPFGLDDCRGTLDEYARALARAKGLSEDAAYIGCMRALREYGELTETSSQLLGCSSIRDSLSVVSRQVAYRRKTGVPYEGMRDLWGEVSSISLEETQDLFKSVLVRTWKTQCDEALGTRVNRLGCLSNSLAPQLAEVIGRVAMNIA